MLNQTCNLSQGIPEAAQMTVWENWIQSVCIVDDFKDNKCSVSAHVDQRSHLGVDGESAELVIGNTNV